MLHSENYPTMLKVLGIGVAIFLGLLMVGLFTGVALGGDSLASLDLVDRFNNVLDAPDDDADLRVAKTPSQNPVVAGTTLTYTISITNSGVITASGVVLTDTLPAGVTFLSSAPGSPGCAHASGVVHCSLGSLAVGASRQVTLTVQVSSAVSGTLSNQAEVGATTLETNPADNTVVQTTTVDTEADLAVQKSDAPDPVVAGELLTYILSLTNRGPSDASGVSLVDELPTGVGYVGVVPGEPVCIRHARTITCNYASLAAGETEVVTLTVRANDGVVGPLSNPVIVSAGTTDPNLVNNSDTESTSIAYRANLSLVKTGSASARPPGGTLSYTLTVSNSGPGTVPGVVMTDTLPVGMVYQSVTTNKGSCGHTTTVNCSLGTFTSGESASIAIGVSVAQGTAPGVLTNTAIVTATGLVDTVPGNNAASYPVTVTEAEVDLSVSLSDAPDPVTAGELLTYTLRVSNAGPSNASGVIVTDAPPAVLGLISVASSQGHCSGSLIVICDLGNLAAGSSAGVTLTGEVSSAALGAITNLAEVTGDDADSVLSNNSASVTTQVNAEADLEIGQYALPEAILAGAPVTYTLVITNHGPSLASNLIIQDNLPTEALFTSSTPGAPGCQHVVGVVSCSLPSLSPGASETITIVVQVSAGMVGWMNNQATIDASTFDPVSANDISLLSVQVRAEIVPPTVTWQYPVTDGGVLQVAAEIVLLQAQASDNVGIEHLRFYRWDAVAMQYVEIGVDYSPPYQSTLNTALLNPDWNQIFVESYDVSGNRSARKHIWLVRDILIYFPFIRR